MTELPFKSPPRGSGESPGVPHHLPLAAIVAGTAAPLPASGLSGSGAGAGAGCGCAPVAAPAYSPAVPSKRVLELPESPAPSADDRILVDSPTLGTRQTTVEGLGHSLGATRTVRVFVNRGPGEDWAEIPVGEACQATVWFPSYPSGQPVACGQTIVFRPERALRLSFSPGQITSASVDVVITST